MARSRSWESAATSVTPREFRCDTRQADERSLSRAVRPPTPTPRRGRENRRARESERRGGFREHAGKRIARPDLEHRVGLHLGDRVHARCPVQHRRELPRQAPPTTSSRVRNARSVDRGDHRNAQAARAPTCTSTSANGATADASNGVCAGVLHGQHVRACRARGVGIGNDRARRRSRAPPDDEVTRPVADGDRSAAAQRMPPPRRAAASPRIAPHNAAGRRGRVHEARTRRRDLDRVTCASPPAIAHAAISPTEYPATSTGGGKRAATRGIGVELPRHERRLRDAIVRDRCLVRRARSPTRAAPRVAHCVDRRDALARARTRCPPWPLAIATQRTAHDAGMSCEEQRDGKEVGAAAGTQAPVDELAMHGRRVGAPVAAQARRRASRNCCARALRERKAVPAAAPQQIGVGRRWRPARTTPAPRARSRSLVRASAERNAGSDHRRTER